MISSSRDFGRCRDSPFFLNPHCPSSSKVVFFVSRVHAMRRESSYLQRRRKQERNRERCFPLRWDHGSPLYRKPKRLLREATSRVLDKTARLRASVSSYSFFSFLFFGKWRICAKRARKGKKLGIGGDPPLFLAFIGLQRRVAERVAHEKSNHLTLLPLMKLPRHARRKKQ